MENSQKIEKVAVNDFVRRQVTGSGKTYAQQLSFENIAEHAEKRMKNGFYKEGYRKGVIIVEADNKYAKKFICPFVKITADTKLKAKRVFRRDNEEPYIQIRALIGKPLKAGKVEFILYHHDVLAENNEHSTMAEWELISIHAIPEGIDLFPMGPVTMMRNQLKLQGGTSAKYTSEEWASAIQFWQSYAALEKNK